LTPANLVIHYANRFWPVGDRLSIGTNPPTVAS